MSGPRVGHAGAVNDSMDHFGPVLEQRTANLLSPSATSLRWLPLPMRAAIGAARKVAGGLWIGGTAILRERSLQFQPNALNAGMHEGRTSFVLVLDRLRSIAVRRALATSIITLDTDDPDLPSIELRCWDARGFAARIEAASQASRRR